MIVVGGLLLAGIGAYVGVNTYQCCKIFKEYQPIMEKTINTEMNDERKIKDMIFNQTDETTNIQTVPRPFDQMKHFNVMVFGKTGIGKSTLINEVLHLTGNQMAETGQINTIKNITSYENEVLRIFDTEGVNLSNNGINNCTQAIIAHIQAERESNKEDLFIHCVWYYISGAPEQVEVNAINAIRKTLKQYGLPVIIVNTNTRLGEKEKEEVRNHISNNFTNPPKLIFTLAKDCSINGTNVSYCG